MSSRSLSRRSKAITLVPLAVLSAVWTGSLVTSSASADQPTQAAAALPDGTSVPSDAIEAPASVPTAGVIAPAVPQGSADSIVSGASSNGIPAPALSAYQRAGQIIDAADKGCNLPWEIVAAIGRVESDHGRYNGNTLTDEGVSKPGIYGIPLNGKNGTQAINDTDGGQLDKDTVYDRAVGSMQFIPSTWQVVKVDADGDGERNPQDIDDSALATAVYLCSGKDDLSKRAGQEAAVYRYNHSREYVDLVLRIMEAYSSGDYTAVPSGAQGGSSFSPASSSYSSQIEQRYEAARERKAKARAAKIRRERAAQLGGGSGGSLGGSSSGSTGGVVPGTSSGGTTTSGGGNVVGDTVKKATDTVDKVVGGVTGGLTGGGGGGSSSPAPAPVKETLSYAEAKTKCLAQGISALDLAKLNSCIANLTS